MRVKYLSSILVDFTIVFTFSYLLKILLQYFVIIDHRLLWIIFVTINFVYFYFTYSRFGTTPGKSMFDIALVRKTGELSNRLILFRELCVKTPLITLFFLILDYVALNILNILHMGISLMQITFFIFLFLLINIVIFLCSSNSIWGLISKTKFERLHQDKRVSNYAYVIFALFIIFSYSIIRFENNINQNSTFSVMGIEYPYLFPKYPYNDTNEYVEFLSKQQSAKDYIFELFRKNDIVILCEPAHREIKSWEFISDLVSDQRFINNVGHVFSEYGDASEQTRLDSFLNTSFTDVVELEKATSNLMWFMSLGFFNYLKGVNILNSQLPEELKIKHYFCDVGVHQHTYTSSLTSYLRGNRDKLMAEVLIDKYQNEISSQKRKKCLLVTNYRHAYNLHKKGQRVNQAEFIFDKFPDNTANVLINTYARNLYLLFHSSYPIHQGKWDLAFEKNNNKQVGFDFKGNIFGNDHFDHSLIDYEGLEYKDVFTGFIFINSLDEWVFKYKNIPYAQESRNNERIRKGYPVITNVTNDSKREIIPKICECFVSIIRRLPIPEIVSNFYNFIPLAIFLLSATFSLCISTVYCISCLLRGTAKRN